LRYRAGVKLRSNRLQLWPLLTLTVASALACASAPPAPAAKPATAAPAPAAPTATAGPTAAAAPAPLVPDGPPVERVAVPADGPARGPATAKVTIVEFSDFQCPFCARVNPTLEKIRATYGDDVRIVFRHNPLPFHANAEPAAEAAVLAGWSGKFWEMHDKLFGNQQELDRDGLERRASELGMDVAAFRKALDAHTAKPRVDADLALGQKIGVLGTPAFFIDGRPITGAQPFEAFKQIIDDEIARADSLLRRGLPRDKLYATLLTGADASIPRAGAAGTEAAKEIGWTVYRVPTLDAPVRGSAVPKVTLIEFGDFESPYAARVAPTIEKLLQGYGVDLALVYRHYPLSFHPHGEMAALAAEAARAQGKFWEMHDQLYANQKALDRESLEKYAAAIGLDMARFRADLDAALGKDRLTRDVDDAHRFGVEVSPTFFVNGRVLTGNQPIGVFRMAIDEEIRRANALLGAGTKRADLYAQLTKDGLDKKETPPPPPKPRPHFDDDARLRIDVAGAPVRGPADAPITIVEFADFQCPFCARAEETLAELGRAYPGQIRFVWRDLPLPFHQQARPAALAARAAGAQGRFWAMHDRLYAAPTGTLGPERFERDAAELGLDTKRFHAALEDEKGAAAKGIEADELMATKSGTGGTPTFFINGKRLVGAQPVDAFKTLIDGELKIANEMIAKGTPRGKVYAALMKDAEPLRPPPAKDDGSPPSPEADTTIYPVKPGDGPSKGPADAPLLMVVFSDFQCPFCKRVEPTLADLERHYAGKLRTVWKNYPLPFHNNALPAAEAAMAADAQGKFWQMHDILFANNMALDRDSLEKYAAEIGLDVARFKADLDAERYKARIEADTKEGTDVGVNGTPAVFINGRKIGGAYPLETFQKVADQELAKTEKGGQKGGQKGSKDKKAVARKGAKPPAP
jgi:protein-disulfide isomerase